MSETHEINQLDEQRTVCFDPDLRTEAYQFKGLKQRFPNHFHEYYVIGCIEKGKRRLTCNNIDYTIIPGDLVMFNPLENHACEQLEDEPLYWRCINISTNIMEDLTEEITGSRYTPKLTATVLRESELAPLVLDLHQLILDKGPAFEKEERLYFILQNLLTRHSQAPEPLVYPVSDEIQLACNYMENHYSEQITLDDLCQISGLKKYTLLRYFTRQRGLTPYQYLETIRVNKAKTLLEQGVTPIDTAIQSGFTDQSHFTRFFKNFIGLTPRQYQDIFR